MEKMVTCKSCGKEIAKSAKACPECGAKNKKPIFKKWWFWVLVVIVIAIIGSSGGNDSSENSSQGTDTTQSEEIIYESVDLGIMIDELNDNALKAEKTYNNKRIEFEGKISNFDSDGSYISVEPKNADAWNFYTAMCYIKNDEQLNFLLEKNVDDIVTIKGKVKSVGEVLGYSIDIAEVY